MKKFRKILFVFVLPALAVFLALGFVVSNAIRPLRNPDLKMTEISVVELKHKITAEDSLQIAASLKQLKGIYTYTINRETSLLAVSYFPDQTDKITFLSILRKSGYDAMPKEFASDPDRKKCPIPSVWLYKISNTFRF